MPTLAQTELNSLIEPLKQYSQEAVQRTIDAARNPEIAEQLAGYLDSHFNEDGFNDFAVIGLCVALGEAHAEKAIPALLRAATYQEVDTGMYGEAALYALQRMGRPAFDAAMQFIRSDDRLWERVEAYDVLLAAVDADEQTRREVGDFCFSRLRDEVNREWDDDWHAGLSCCHVLVVLRDQRVRPVLEEVAQQHEFYQNLLGELNGGERCFIDTDWRTPWPELCEEWSDFLKDNTEDDEDDEDKEFAEEAEELRREFNELTEAFAKSPRAQGLPTDPEESASEIFHFLCMGLDYVSTDFSWKSISEVREVLYEWLPRKLSAEPEYFSRFPSVLAAFFHFLHDAGRLPEPRPHLKLAEEAMLELPRRAADPRNWGMAKSFFMLGEKAGFDMSEERQAKDFMLQYNQALSSSREQEGQEDAVYEPIKPIRRESPKVGRNDPCPCGSGKKFKKCCAK